MAETLAMSAENPRPLSGLVHESLALLRASDTFKLVTTKGAEELSVWALRRKAMIDEIREQAPTRWPELLDLRLLELAEAEANAQETLADWLRRLAGGDA
jgi:hypothetical protein